MITTLEVEGNIWHEKIHKDHEVQIEGPKSHSR